MQEHQQEYWNRVANEKTFTHPIDMALVNRLVPYNAVIVDHGCGYGRVVSLLREHGYTNVVGYDTSAALIARGNKDGVTQIYHIPSQTDLPLTDASVDMILLFAVLTCIPSNAQQQELIQLLYAKLKKGGVLYISDYYLQPNSAEMEQYEYLNGDVNNFGVFTLPEGATFRHHTREWMTQLLANFSIAEEIPVAVKTMNGHNADAIQILAVKH